MTAIKPIYNRSTKRYEIKCVEQADPLYAHHGYLVFDSTDHALNGVACGTLIGTWPKVKREAVIEFLAARIAAKS